MKKTQDLHVIEAVPLTPPSKTKEELPITDRIADVVVEGRQAIKRMLRGKDNRLLMIAGPCSIHDEKAAYEYAEKLAKLAEEVRDQILVVMRVYFEKPRTVIGWKGLIYDPQIDGSADIAEGIRLARRILLRINDMGLPAATEFLDPIVPQYIDDLIAWAAIGARTTESQTHREMSSGLSMPVGYKNSTDGNLQIAVDAMNSSRYPHSFLGINQEGQTCIINTSGNVWGHIILRGGRSGPNYGREDILGAKQILAKANLPEHIMIDCSHANSNKDFRKQEEVLREVIDRRLEDESFVFGAMLESNLFEGNQSIPDDLSKLAYGVSITDSCIGWDATERVIREACQRLRQNQPQLA